MKLTPSQISSYVFCPNSWHLTQTKGFRPTQQTIKGTQHHEQVSQNQTKAKVLYILIILAIIAIIILTIRRSLI